VVVEIALGGRGDYVGKAGIRACRQEILVYRIKIRIAGLEVVKVLNFCWKVSRNGTPEETK